MNKAGDKLPVALRKESVDRNLMGFAVCGGWTVALRKESVDRNSKVSHSAFLMKYVALRKESVDRNCIFAFVSALCRVALRKESVDRNVDNLDGAAAGDSRSPQGERG